MHYNIFIYTHIYIYIYIYTHTHTYMHAYTYCLGFTPYSGMVVYTATSTGVRAAHVVKGTRRQGTGLGFRV